MSFSEIAARSLLAHSARYSWVSSTESAGFGFLGVTFGSSSRSMILPGGGVSLPCLVGSSRPGFDPFWIADGPRRDPRIAGPAVISRIVDADDLMGTGPEEAG